MAKIHGRTVSLYLDDENGASTAFTGDGNSVTFNTSIDAPEVTSFGNHTRQFLAGGLRTFELSMDGFVNMPDSTASIAQAIIQTASGVTRMRYGPNGSDTNNQEIQACIVLTEFNQENPVDGAATFSLTVQPRSGSLTYQTW